ncbi:glycoprotein [Hymenopteran orino-related virus OKIAV87]|uniref:Glycoprotein n=1 Tax=Hymenopteran orino-related virus OKIAV87 TaxID=2746371 RepID=A0A7D7F2W4_9MONO|nr:glycoprotein [Hymenopteran orino-related virus OKIAV87]QMP82161.1 glycoprotein [Hymenopteran orino-related virus OKIAV87]
MMNAQAIAAATLVLLATGCTGIQLCQKTKGMKVFKRPVAMQCDNGVEKAATPAYIELQIPNYKPRTESAHWVGLYSVTCRSHYFFWGSYTSENWRQQVSMTPEDARAVRAGSCPSQTHPSPLLTPPPQQCKWAWPQQTDTAVTYCITRPTIVRQEHGQPLQADEEPLTRCSWSDGVCRTVSGAYVYWEKDNDDRAPAYITRYSGPAHETGQAWVITELQEAYVVDTKVAENATHITYSTTEHFLLTVRKGYRHKRGINHQLADLGTALHSEFNSKMEYNSVVMDTYLSRFQHACQQQTILAKALSWMTRVDPDPYVRALLDTNAITAEVTESYILVWPCIQVSSWGLQQVTREDTCTVDIPIWYELNGNRTGYLDIPKNEIKNSTDVVPCNTVPHRPVQREDKLYLWTGRTLQALDYKNLSTIPLLRGTQASYAPTWRNTWLYEQNDFTFVESDYLTTHDALLQQAPDNPHSYNEWMRTPFVGMPTLPSLTRILEITCMIGGALYLWALLRTLWNRVYLTPATPTAPLMHEMEMTPMVRYNMAKKM